MRSRAKKAYFFFDFFPENNQVIKLFCKNQAGGRWAKVVLKARDRRWSVAQQMPVG